MRIAFCGKGGSGKTSLASLFIRYLMDKNEHVLAIDGDINQHLGAALGLDERRLSSLPRLGQQMEILKEYVSGQNKRIKPEHVIESTPAGRGSNFITFEGNDPVSHHFIYYERNLRFMAVGGHQEDDIGKTCFHKFTGAEGIFLNHFLDKEDEFVIGDMCAGADPFASSGLATRYDAIFLVLEPTLKSIGVYDQARLYADPFGIRLFIIANKITSSEDIQFIEERTGQRILTAFDNLSVIRNFEKGREYTVSDLEDRATESLEIMHQAALSLGSRDWKKYIENGKFFHERSASGWASAAYGVDLMEQIDLDFDYEAVYEDFVKAV
ncbi:MAG: ATP-binding protein [Micavibrio aeruginosavorus]|uniref:ATP-binding protein n=1 Tax=Micavibrio aeruginosavorus TaxID=349221 RepID=A0A2W5FIP3_9BACT|nr:MAG: ATP-binding protein [Micavibrio aeruginosavorus]